MLRSDISGSYQATRPDRKSCWCGSSMVAAWDRSLRSTFGGAAAIVRPLALTLACNGTIRPGTNPRAIRNAATTQRKSILRRLYASTCCYWTCQCSQVGWGKDAMGRLADGNLSPSMKAQERLHHKFPTKICVPGSPQVWRASLARRILADGDSSPPFPRWARKWTVHRKPLHRPPGSPPTSETGHPPQDWQSLKPAQKDIRTTF